MGKMGTTRFELGQRARRKANKFAALAQYGDDNQAEWVVAILGAGEREVHRMAFKLHDEGGLADPKLVALTADQAEQEDLRVGAIVGDDMVVRGWASERGETRKAVR